MSNRLQGLAINQQSSLIGGLLAGVSSPEEGIGFWSLDNGKLKELIRIAEPLIDDYEYSWDRAGEPSHKFESLQRIAISHDGNLIAVSFFTMTVGCYSLKEKKWLWVNKWLKEERDSPQKLAFTHDDKKLIAVGEKKHNNLQFKNR